MIEQYVSREELRRLLSALLATVGAITLFALFAFIVVPGLRNANKPAARPPVAPPQLEAGWLDPTEYPPARGYVLPPIDPQTVLRPNPKLLARGKALYQKNCAQCHGDSGKGDGPASKGLRPAPRDFTEATGWMNGYTLTRIYKTLTHGVPKTAMASFAHLRTKDRMALVHYVRSFGAFEHGPDDPAAVAALAEQLASGGGKIPNRIPVSMAIEHLAAESPPAPPVHVQAAGQERANAALLNRLVRNRVLVAQTLARVPSWRTSGAALARLVAPGSPTNGFAVATATLDASGWENLRRALIEATTSTRGQGE